MFLAVLGFVLPVRASPKTMISGVSALIDDMLTYGQKEGWVGGVSRSGGTTLGVERDVHVKASRNVPTVLEREGVVLNNQEDVMCISSSFNKERSVLYADL